MALVVLGLLASVLALVPAAPAQATPGPVLIVGGHGSENEHLEYIADLLGLSGGMVRVVELATEPDWDLPWDDPDYGDWPGTASNEVSAVDVQDAIEDLYGASGVPVDVVTISQSGPVVRWLLQENPANVRSKVAGYVSLSGANLGISELSPDPLVNLLVDWCETFEWLTVCEEMIWEPGWPTYEQPGETDWLEEVNQAGYDPFGTWGDPTPDGQGDATHTIDYYNIYSELTPDGVDEGTLGYDWSVPLLGAQNVSAQQACSDPNQVAPHAGLWLDPAAPFGFVADPVMAELAVDALERDPLVVDDPVTTCVDNDPSS